MDKNDKDPSHNPEKKTDLIIISPEELVKLGLFQDFSALISSSSSPSPQTPTNPKEKSTASSSTPKKKSKTTPTPARKRSSTPKHETCFKKPEASPKMLPSSKQSPVTAIQPIPPEKHPPHFSKSNPLPCEITQQTASESSRPVRMKNLEHIKQILTESISRSRSLAKEKSKKELKVISDDVVSFSSKELKDLIGKAKIQKDCISDTAGGSKTFKDGKLFPNKPSSLIITSRASTVTQNTSKDLKPKFELIYSQQLDSSLSDIQGETTEYFPFPNDTEISELSGTEDNNSTNISNSIEQEESTVLMQKVDLITCQREDNNPLQNTAKIKKDNAVYHIQNHSLKEDNSGEPSMSGEQQNCSSTSVLHQDEDSVKNENSEVKENKTTESNLLPNESRRSRERSTEKMDCSSQITENLKQEENTIVRDSIFDKRRQLLLREKANDEALTQVTNNQLLAGTSGFTTNTSEFERNIESSENEPVGHLLSKYLQNHSSSSVLSQDYSSSDVKEELKKEIEGDSLESDKKNNSLRIGKGLKQEENTSDTKKLDSVSDQNEKLFFNKRKRQPRTPLVTKRKRAEAVNDTNNSDSIADTTSIVTNNPELKRITDMSLRSSEEQPSSSKQKDSSTPLPNESEISRELFTEQLNTHVTKKIDSVLDRRKRQHRKPLLVERKKTKTDYTNDSPVADSSNTVKNTPELNSAMDFTREHSAEHLLSTEQLDSSPIPVSCQNELSAKRLSSVVKEEMKTETNESVSFSDELERSRELCNDEQNNYAPKISEDQKQEERTTVTKKVDSILDRRRRQHRKPVLIDKKKNKSEQTNNDPVEDTLNTVKDTSELNGTVDFLRETPVDHLLSTEQLASPSIPVSCQKEFYEDFAKRQGTNVEEDLKKETGENVSISNELERSRELCTEQNNYSPKISEDVKQEENTTVAKDFDRRRQHKKPLLIESKTNKSEYSNNNPINDTSEFSSKLESSKEMLIETAAEKSPSLPKLVEVVESVSAPKVVESKGRSRKRHLDSSELDESIETVEVLEKPANEVDSEIKTTVDETGDNKIVNDTTEIEPVSNVIHCSTPLPKKRGRPKKNHPEEEKKGKKLKADDTESFPIEEKYADTSTANEVLLNDSSLLGTTQSAKKKGKISKANNTKSFTNEVKDMDTGTANEIILNDSSSQSQSNKKKEKTSKSNNTKSFINEEKYANTNTANEVILNDSSLLGTTRSAKKKGKQSEANNKKSFTNEEKHGDTSTANEVTLNDSSLLDTTQSAKKKGKISKANDEKSFTNEEKDACTDTANEVILNDSSLLGTTRSAKKKGKQSEANNKKSFTNEEKHGDTSTANEVTLNDSSLLGTTQSAKTKGKISKANDAKSFTNEEKDSCADTANEVILNDSSLLGTTRSAKKKGKQSEANNKKSFTNEEKHGDTSTANEVTLNDSSLLGTTQSAKTKGKISKANDAKSFTNEEKDSCADTANEVILNDSSLLGTTRSAKKKGKQSEANNKKSFTNEEKHGDTSTANEVTLNDSSLLGTTQSAKKKGKTSKANNTKSFTNEEKDAYTDTANEVILNDSSLLGTTRSAKKKGKKSEANSTKSFTNEEKPEDTSTANAVILNDSSLLGTTRSAKKNGKQSEAINTKSFTNKEEDADTSNANEVILNDSSLLGTTRSAKKKGNKSNESNSKIFTNEKKDADTSTVNEMILNDSSLLGATLSDDDTTESLNTSGSTKAPKKCGRPRKNALATTVSLEPAVSYTIEKSRSGRTRRKVDYLELELNSLRGTKVVELAQLDAGKNKSLDMDDDFIIPKKTRVYVRKTKTEVSDFKEVKNKLPLNDKKVASESLDGSKSLDASGLDEKCTALSDIPEKCTAVPDALSNISEKFTVAPSASSDASEKCTAIPGVSSDISKKCTAVSDASFDISEKCTAVPDVSSDISENYTDVPDASSAISEKYTAVLDLSSDISENNEAKRSIGEDNNENTSTTIKSKYVWNGYTTDMLNSVFSAAFRGDQDIPVPPSSSSSQELIGKKRKGRPKKFAEDVSDNGDPEIEVSCVSCEEKLANSEWDCHNATRHYNLAWRKGELALNLDDDAVIKQKLKTLMPKRKTLACEKCGHSCKDQESFIIHREECLGILANGVVTCAVCNSKIERRSWLNHKLRIHNNLAWRVGDFPLDLNDQNYVLSVLNAIYKTRKPLFCDKCQMSKKSVVGFLSHRSQCGILLENAKVECKLCGKKVLPVSMPSHIKAIHDTVKETPDGSDYFNVDPSAKKKKRRAAKDAMMIIDSITSAGESKGPQVKPYKTNPVDFKEEKFVIPPLESELEQFMMIKCKFENCSFNTDNIESTLDHLNSCSKKPEEFQICTLCLLVCVSETDIRQHLTDVHDVFLPNEKGSDEEGSTSGEEHEMEQTAKKLKKKVDAVRLQKSQRLKPLCISQVGKTSGCLFNGAYQFTWEFCSNNYNQPLLYDKFRHFAWNLLPSNLINDYLPLADNSCDVARIKVRGFNNVLAQEHTFKQFDLFQVEREDEHTTFFCGGPITAMAWTPTPYTSREASQVLAVATAKDFDSKYRVNAIHEEPSMIQFWDFGPLANKGPYPVPSQMLFLALDCGPIWHLEWCPSGCYDQEASEGFERLGLLAVAGSVPTVFIYSIPMIKDEEKRGLFYKEEPLLKLQIHPSNTMQEINFYPTKISWTKAPEHKYIAVGYSNGMVALFNVHSPSPLLIIREPEGGGVLLPYRVISAHKHYISALSLVHLQGGDKILLTGSFDKDVHVWNLNRRTKMTAPKKRIITDGAWLTNWLSYVTVSDDSNCVNNLTSSTVTAFRYYLSDPAPIMFSKSKINSITASDWLNGFVQGNEAGEVQASFQGQMLYSLDAVRKGYLRRYFISYTKLIDKHKSPEARVAEEAAKQKIITISPGGLRTSMSDLAATSDVVYNYFEPITYAGARKKYGLVFCDFKMDSLGDFPLSSQKKLSGRHEVLGTSKPNLYSLQAANKVCFNPNCQASLYFATGYQAGFVRVSYLKFLEKDAQIRKSM